MTHFDNTVQSWEQSAPLVNEADRNENVLGIEALRLLDKESARKIDTSDGWAPGSVLNSEGKKVYASWAVEILDAGQYTSKSGDNLQQIAKRSLGVTGNPDASPKEVQAEMKRIVELNKAEHPELKSGKVYEGTTLNLKSETSSQFLEIPSLLKDPHKGIEPHKLIEGDDPIYEVLKEKGLVGRSTPGEKPRGLVDLNDLPSEPLQFKPMGGIKLDDLQTAFDEFLGRRPKLENYSGIPESQKSHDPLTSEIQDKLFAKLSPEQQKHLIKEMREHEEAVHRWSTLMMINAPYPVPGKMMSEFNSNVSQVSMQAREAASKAVDAILAKGARQRH